MYLMTVSTLSFDEALTVVQHCREMANPNAGFRTQLMRYQEDLLLVGRVRVCGYGLLLLCMCIITDRKKTCFKRISRHSEIER